MLQGRSPCGSPGSCHWLPNKHDLTATFLISNRQFDGYSPEPDGLISIKLSPEFPVIRRILARSSCPESPQAEDSCADTRAPSAPGGVSRLTDHPLGSCGSLCPPSPPPKPDCGITSTRPRGGFGWGVAPHRRPIAQCSRDKSTMHGNIEVLGPRRNSFFGTASPERS